MWYLLYDSIHQDFELFYDNASNSTTYYWFDLSCTTDMFGNASHYKHNVHTWIQNEFNEFKVYILHSFLTQPTQDEVIAAIHSHPELLI